RWPPRSRRSSPEPASPVSLRERTEARRSPRPREPREWRRRPRPPSRTRTRSPTTPTPLPPRRPTRRRRPPPPPPPPAAAAAAAGDDGGSSSRNTWIAGLIALLILAAVAFLVYRLLSGPTQTPAVQVTVPSFVGMTIPEAKALATQTGIAINVAGSAQA